jgi:hypothetical protein
MNKQLMGFDEVVKQIKTGRRLILSASEAFISRLPSGNWIGGTSPYSMSSEGGSYSEDKAYIQIMPDYVKNMRIKAYGVNEIKDVYQDAFESGFSVILIPAFTDILVQFAMQGPRFPQFGQKPLIGWVTGAKLDVLGRSPAKVLDGSTGTVFTDKALVAHLELPTDKFADIGTINIFDIKMDGDVLQFDTDGWEVENVKVNGGPERNFSEYLTGKKVDLRWPLVGQYNGTMVNSSFSPTDKLGKTVQLFAPVFRGVNYRLSMGAGDYNAYLEAFRKKVASIEQSKVVVTCNCIFNFLYGDLEGKNLDELNGPFVFGEVAYQLHNQTLVYLTVDDK